MIDHMGRKRYELLQCRVLLCLLSTVQTDDAVRLNGNINVKILTQYVLIRFSYHVLKLIQC